MASTVCNVFIIYDNNDDYRDDTLLLLIINYNSHGHVSKKIVVNGISFILLDLTGCSIILILFILAEPLQTVIIMPFLKRFQNTNNNCNKRFFCPCF